MKLSRAILALAMTSVVALAGCTAPEPAPSATATASAPTPMPTPAAEPEVKVVVTTLTLDVYEDDVLTESWAHADRDPDEIPGLTEVFGAEPVATTETFTAEGGGNREIYTRPGFELGYTTWEAGERIIRVTATAAAVGDVSVEAAGGAQVGDDAQSLAAATPDTVVTLDSPSGDVLSIKVDQIPLAADPDGVYSTDGGPSADFVALFADSPSTTVTRIVGPTNNYGL